MRWIFLALAVWGTVHPMGYFVAWFQANGWDLMAMVNAWHVNDATSGLVWDLTIAAVSLTILVLYLAVQTRRWVYLSVVPATFCIGVSAGLPLFVFFYMGGSRPTLRDSAPGSEG